MSGAADFYEELRREYLSEAPARLAELRKDLAAVQAGEPDAAVSLKSRFHRLAGSGGSYGFPEITSLARGAEAWLTEHPDPRPDGAATVENMIRQIAASFDRAALALGLPTLEPPAAAAFGWRALVLGSAGSRRDDIETLLRDAQYVVDRKPLGFEPTEIPVSERPDLAVILAEDGEDMRSLVAAWGQPGPVRPGAVVLVEASQPIDPLFHPFASVDAVIPAGHADRELVAFARALGRSATAPRSVLIVDHSEPEVRGLVGALEGVQVDAKVTESIAGARSAVEEGHWDAVVVDWRLRETTAPAVIRWLRHQPGHRLTPVIVLGNDLSDADRLAAIRAGADDVQSKNTPPAHLLHAIAARIDRSRAIRSAAHRDEATGLLNQEALTDELERAIGIARRNNEQVAYLTFDVDHLRRVNEQHGQHAGDAVLLRVARSLATTIRASDLTARMGGEEFAALIRRCRVEDAVMVANKVRAAIAAAPVQVGGVTIPVRVSAGVACYPDHGADATEVLRAANKALQAAKHAGRDQALAPV
ncbi:MAG: diguanylate cyclase [Gemmatimonadales bacterium]